jgi:quercetin dioxygenase-like cupin family protein
MTRRRTHARRPTRRTLFHSGLASVFGLPGLLAAVGAEAEGDKMVLMPYDKVEPEPYPFGWIRWLMNGQIDPKAEMTLGLVHFEPNRSNVLHIHPNSAEFLHVLSGSVENLMDGRWVTLKPGDTLRIPKGVPHQARTKDQPFRALIVYDTPNRVMVPVAGNTPP